MLANTRIQELSHFEINRQLGKGGMGEVYLAFDTRLKRDVALKFLINNKSSNDNEAELVNEARTLSRLHHPGVCKVIDYVPQAHCLIMEYIPGLALNEMIANNHGSPSERVGIAEDLIRAVIHIHESGVIHGDIKPSNIVLRNQRPVLVDFGISRLSSVDETSLSNIHSGTLNSGGTLAYTAPEIFLGGSPTATSDLFSLGCVLYEIFCNTHPFQANSQAALLHNILNLSIDHNELENRGVPMEWRQRIVDCLDKQVQHRQLTNRIRRKTGTAFSTMEERPKFYRYSVRAFLVIFMILISATSGWYYFHQEQAQNLANQTSLVSIDDATLRVGIVIEDNLEDAGSTSSPRPQVSGRMLKIVADGLLMMDTISLRFLNNTKEFLPLNENRLDEQLIITPILVDKTHFIQLKRLDVRSHEIKAIQLVELVSNPLGNSNNSRLNYSQVLTSLYTLYAKNFNQYPLNNTPLTKQQSIFFKESFISIKSGNSNKLEILNGLVELTKQHTSPTIDLLILTLSHDVFTDTDQTGILEHGLNALARLKVYYSDPLELLYAEGLLRLDQNKIDAARDSLKKLSLQSPNSFQYHLLHSRILETKGDLKGALSSIKQAVKIQQSWGLLMRVAKLATNIGQFEDARLVINGILQQLPDNTTAKAQLALIELLGGDILLAEKLYNQLLTVKNHRSYRVNLGLVYMLKKEYFLAKNEFERAVNLSPTRRVAKLNLADAETSLGNTQNAKKLYRQLLEDFNPDVSYSASRLLLYSQCLARLGDYSKAIALTQKVLLSAHIDAEIAFQVSLIYTLAGEIHSAKVYRDIALKQGMDSRWFRLPSFTPDL